MHHLTLEEPVPIGPQDAIVPGEYYLDDVMGGHLLAFAGGGTMRPLVEKRPFDQSQDWNGKSILFARAGGFGDLLLLTPVLRELNRRWPGIKIAVSTMGRYADILRDLPYVTEILTYPIPKATADAFDAWVMLENAIERNPLARTKHMTDLFAAIVGLDDFEDKLPDYRVSGAEAAWSKEFYPRVAGLRRVCIQVGTSAVSRTYHRQLLGVAVATLLKGEWEVYLMGVRGANGRPEVETDERPHLRNLCMDDLAFRQSCAVLNAADAFIGSDSALLHVAGALTVPAVGLYGPFPWQLRTLYCPTTLGLQGTGHCAPCFHHESPNRRNLFPKNCPSAAKGYCEVLARIEPQAIVDRVNLTARGFKLTVVEPEVNGAEVGVEAEKRI